MSSNIVSTNWTEHIEMRSHHINQFIKDGVIQINQVPTSEQEADG